MMSVNESKRKGQVSKEVFDKSSNETNISPIFNALFYAGILMPTLNAAFLTRAHGSNLTNLIPCSSCFLTAKQKSYYEILFNVDIKINSNIKLKCQYCGGKNQ